MWTECKIRLQISALFLPVLKDDFSSSSVANLFVLRIEAYPKTPEDNLVFLKF